MSEQEWPQVWRDALAELFWMELQRGRLVEADIDDILATLGPLRERERQQARQEALTEIADRLEHACDTEIELLRNSKERRWRWRRMREVLAVQSDPIRITQHYFHRAALLVRNSVAAGGVS